jgi:hypothetical protein
MDRNKEGVSTMDGCRCETDSCRELLGLYWRALTFRSREPTREERDVLALRRKTQPRRDEVIRERADLEKQRQLLVIGRL